MCGGGPKAPAPSAQYTDPVTGKAFWTSDLLNQAINEREQAEAAKSAQLKAEQEARKITERNTFAQQRDTATKLARDNASQYFSQYGADPTKYQSDIERAIQTSLANIPDLSPNPAGFFAPTLGSDLFTQLTTAGRERARQKFSNTFDSSAVDRALGNELIDPVRNNILAEQFDPLSVQLGTARKRGTLNDTGYNAALTALTGAKGKASAEIDNAGRSVLGSGQKSLRELLGSFSSDVNSMSLPQLENVDFTDEQMRFNNEASRLAGGFGSQVQSAIGDTKFADLNTLLNAGGAVQGAINSPVRPGGGGGSAIEDLLAQQISSTNKARGLGNTGVF